jgi:hypothetical protein
MTSWDQEEVEVVAEICHEVNRAYCESVGDMSQVAWDHAPEWQKKSAIDGVAFFFLDPTKTPSQMHANWMKQKLVDGWTYGPEKDPVAKKHPCISPYEQLPDFQRTKDRLFLAVCQTARRVRERAANA